MKSVFFKNDGGGWCVEVRRDSAAWAAHTLCGMVITLPGATSDRKPTCPACLAELARKEARS